MLPLVRDRRPLMGTHGVPLWVLMASPYGYSCTHVHCFVIGMVIEYRSCKMETFSPGLKRFHLVENIPTGWKPLFVHKIIICLYKIAILHHGMQSFHIIVYCTLVYCTIADHSDCFPTSISLCEHVNEERYAAQNF